MLDIVDTPIEDEAPRKPSITLGREMQSSFLNYAASVVLARAVPDVRDGLKPVHRRIIYTMETGDYVAGKQHKKSARIVGDVMGKLHPHGDQAIYDAMVRLAQEWVMRSPLIDGQGNFGSIDGDPPAAMRYSEARMSRLAHELTRDIEKDTVDFRPNYDGRELEPVVLPARFPNVLINGQTGIAVGMATNIPPHNLGEVMTTLLALLDNPDLSLDDIIKLMPGPDFPTRGVILGTAGIRESYATGRGHITMSGVWKIEQMKGNRERIVITELPYLVNKEQFILKIKELVEHEKDDQRLNGISDLRDESEKDIRVVIELKRDADPQVILNRLKRDTELIKKWHHNATCLDSTGRPREMPVPDILREFIAFRRQVVERRTIHDLNKARDELHKQIALYAATSRIDEVIRTIRNSEDADDARGKLLAMRFPTDGGFAQLLREADPDTEPGTEFQLDVDQANAILALALRTLTGLEREKIAGRARDLSHEINGYLEILNDKMVLDAVVRRELEEIKVKYSEPRLTVIEATEHDQVMDEALIERKDIVINLTARGYVKRTELNAFREQKRGGTGKSGMDTKEDDYVVSSFVCTTKTPLVFFTNRGMAFALKAWQLPDMGPNNRGRALANFINLRNEERVTAVVTLPEDKTELENLNLMFVTNFGTIRRNAATDFATVNKSGKIAMEMDTEGGRDARLIAVLPLSPEDDVMIATAKGQIVRFPAEKVRLFSGRTSAGVRAVELGKDDYVISASTLKHFEVTSAEREMYAGGGSAKFVERNPETGETTEKIERLSDQRLAAMQNADQLILTVCANGYGKTVSSHEYRITDRGGKGVAAGTMFEVTGPVVACFPVESTDGLMLVTDAGQTIRTRVSDIRQVQNRLTKGVRLFAVAEGQKIVAASRLPASSDKEE